MMDTAKLPLIYTWSLELKFMLTNKGKQLDGQFSPVYLEFPQRLEKNILNPGDNQQKKGKKKKRKLQIFTTKSQTAYFSTISLNSVVMFKTTRQVLFIDFYCMQQTTEPYIITWNFAFSFYHGW